MASTGNTGGGTAVNLNTGDVAWTNPTNVLADNTNNSTCDAAKNSALNDILYVSNFGFSIPIGSTIDGITVHMRGRSETNQDARDNRVYLTTTGGQRQGTNKALGTSYNTSITTRTYGSNTDLWGLGANATPELINDSGFGVHFDVISTQLVPQLFYAQYLTMEVWYTPPSNLALAFSPF